MVTATAGTVLGNPVISAERYATGVVLPGGVALKRRGVAPVPAGRGARGIITGFSKSSRRRMVDKLMRLDWNAGKAFFLSLTFHESYGLDASRWHLALKLFRLRLEYRYGERLAGAIWRLEVLPRKSGIHRGELAPHYHLLLCWQGGREPRVESFRRWCSEAWTCVCEPGDGAHLVHGADVQVVHERNGRGALLSYCSKYLAKPSDVRLADPATGEVLSVGRCWGIWRNPPFLVVCALAITGEGWNRLVAAVRAHGERVGSWYLSHLSPLVSGFRVFGEFSWLWNTFLESCPGIEVVPC